MTDTHDIPDREVEVVAFDFDLMFSIEDKPTGRRWWEFWKPKTVKTLKVDDRAWMYAKEVTACSAEVICVCSNQDCFRLGTELLSTLPEEFEYPPFALIPPSDIAWWCRMHRVMLLVDEQSYSRIQNFIVTEGKPQEA